MNSCLFPEPHLISGISEDEAKETLLEIPCDTCEQEFIGIGSVQWACSKLLQNTSLNDIGFL